MSLDSLITFCCALLIWVMIPGPAILAIIANSLTSGLKSSLNLIVGILLGDVFYITLVLVGMTAIGKFLGNFFVFIRIAGALYLIYLGISLWLKDPNSLLFESKEASRGEYKNFLTGFSITLGNPKAILFHLGFLPTFFDPSAIGLIDAFLIILVFLVVLGTSLTFYALVATKVKVFVKDYQKIRILNRGAGTIFIGTGVVLATKQ